MMRHFAGSTAVSMLLLFVLSGLPASAGEQTAAAPAAESQLPASALAETFGIRIKSLTLTAHGHMLDLRYEVVDAEKAKPFLNAEIKPFLVDARSGKKLSVPSTPKIGSLRQKTRAPEAGRQYFMLFGNPGMLLKSGAKATLVVDAIRIEDIVVR